MGDVEEVVVDETGAKTYYIAEGGSVKNLSPDTTILSADLQIRETEEKMELYAGAPREAAGVRTPGEKTKFEVMTLDNARGRVYQHKMRQYEVGFLEHIINGELQLARTYMGKEGDTIRQDDDNGVSLFTSISKEDLTLKGKFSAIGARHFAKQAQIAQNLIQFQQMLAQDQDMALHVSSKELAKLWKELLELGNTKLIQEFIRITERLEAARLQKAAEGQLQSEDKVPVGDENGPA